MKIPFLLFTMLMITCSVSAQLDTLSYPQDRQKIRELLHPQKPGLLIDCNDFIAVGPKGDISFSRQQWQGAQNKQRLVFKSVQAVPGNEIIRVYDGTMAVVNFLAEVKLLVDDREVNIKVRRLEVFHKTGGNWCRVAGQGTEVDEKVFPISSN